MSISQNITPIDGAGSVNYVQLNDNYTVIGNGLDSLDARNLAYYGGSNKNLLINWDFRNPVNQRNQTTYTGNEYTIDMWKLNGTVTINNGYISASTTGQYDAIFTTIENYKFLQNKNVTLTAKVKGVSGKNVRIALLIDNVSVLTKDFVLTGDWQYIQLTTQLTTISTSLQWMLYPGFQSGGGSCDIETTKFELGSISTLANDPPANYGEQLALCQRYYVRYAPTSVTWLGTGEAISTTSARFILYLPQSLRIKPVVEFSDCTIIYEGAGAINVTGISVLAQQSNIITIDCTLESAVTQYKSLNLRLPAGSFIAFNANL